MSKLHEQLKAAELRRLADAASATGAATESTPAEGDADLSARIAEEQQRLAAGERRLAESQRAIRDSQALAGREAELRQLAEARRQRDEEAAALAQAREQAEAQALQAAREREAAEKAAAIVARTLSKREAAAREAAVRRQEAERHAEAAIRQRIEDECRAQDDQRQRQIAEDALAAVEAARADAEMQLSGTRGTQPRPRATALPAAAGWRSRGVIPALAFAGGVVVGALMLNGGGRDAAEPNPPAVAGAPESPPIQAPARAVASMPAAGGAGDADAEIALRIDAELRRRGDPIPPDSARR